METPERQGHLDLGVDRIIFNWVLKKCDTRAWAGSYGSGKGEVAGFVHSIMNFGFHGMREISLY